MTPDAHIGLITSKGGHLFQLYSLKAWWQEHPRFWVTFPGSDVSALLKNEPLYWAHYPESRHVLNAVKNFFLALGILTLERPKYLISAGAGITVPFFYVAKLLGIKTIYLEPFDFIAQPTLTGRLVAPIVDYFLIQHPSQKRFFPKAIYQGAVL